MATSLKKSCSTLISTFLLLSALASSLGAEAAHTDHAKPVISASTALKRGQWIRAAILGINTGILSTASLIIGAGDINQDSKTIIITGATVLLTGALGMGGGEYVSVHAQYDIELSQLLRMNMTREELEVKTRNLPSPFQAAVVSVASCMLGATIPVLAAAFIPEYPMRVCVVVVAVSASLVGFGWLAEVLGQSTSNGLSILRLLGGGWLGMGACFLIAKLATMVGSTME